MVAHSTRIWRYVGLGLLFVQSGTGCGDDSVAPVDPPPEIAFGDLNALVGPEGRDGFRFGAASAATQIEDQNTETDWWVFTAPESEGGLGLGKEFVGEASRGFSKAIEDVALLKRLGLDAYRFSIEWARIEPQRDVIDEAALAHYDAFIDALIDAGIRPMITIHHFSNPRWIADPLDLDCALGPTDENLCGFGHPEGGPLVVEEQRQHAALLAERFGDRVDEWATVNEPINYLLAAYGIGAFPPGHTKVFALEEEFMPVVRHYLLGHAAMYDAIKEADTVDADGDGKAAVVGLTMSVADWVPAAFNQVSDDPVQIAARDRLVFVFHYLFVDSIRNGTFDLNLDGEPDESIDALAGRLDWLGVQYYFRAGVTANDGLIPVVDLTPCFGTLNGGACVPPLDPSFCVPAMRYEFAPEGLHKVLMAYSERYPDLPLLVSESGIATEVGERRAENIVRSLEQISAARADGADVRGYYHWSLYDNFEWAEGYGPRFGLYSVDYSSYDRTATLGADVLAEIVDGRRVTSQHRATYGGVGPMTPESEQALGVERCNQF